MKKILFIVFGLLISITARAQDPIFTPSMSITSYGIVDSPADEGVEKIIDGDINTKFLDFELDDGLGFTVDLGGLSYVATTIKITTANDFEERDPIRFEVFGSNDGSTFTSIVEGIIECISDRFFSRDYEFVNDMSYLHYRVNYTNACDPTGGTGIPSLQVAETQLYGMILGMNETEIANEFILYPNPVNDLIFIESQQRVERVKIFNLQGQLINEESTNSFVVSELKSGLYFVQVTIEGKTITKKFIKS